MLTVSMLSGFGINMIANSHVCVCVSMFLFGARLYILVRYTTPSSPMCFRCLLFTLSGHVELLFIFLNLLPLGLVLWWLLW